MTSISWHSEPSHNASSSNIGNLITACSFLQSAEGNRGAKPVLDDVMPNFEGMHQSTAEKKDLCVIYLIPKQTPDLQLCYLLLAEPSAPKV